MEDSIAPRRIMRLPDVEHTTGLKRSYIYRLIQEKKFPDKIKLGPRSVGWDSRAVDAWVAQKLGEAA